MSTPMTNPAAVRGYARVVDDLDDRVLPIPRQTKPELNEVIGLAERMNALAPESVGPVLDRVWSAAGAIDKAGEQIQLVAAETDDLLDADPDTITARVLDNSRDRATEQLGTHHRATGVFRDALAALTCTALKEAGDATVLALRDDFDKHVKVIETAAKAELNDSTDTAELLASGTPAQIAAFRALPEAVAALDQIAGLRNDMTRILRYGPPLHPVFSFVAAFTTSLDAEGLENRYDGSTELVQHNQLFGSILARVRLDRLGGRWLALATYPGEVKLRLNTADEIVAAREELTA